MVNKTKAKNPIINIKTLNIFFKSILYEIKKILPNLKVVGVLGAEEQSNSVWWTEVPPYDGGTWSPFADRPGLGLEISPDALKDNVIDE